jgi:hypothetical protein
MLYDIIDSLGFPFIVHTSYPFCDIEVGQVFDQPDGKYLLLERNAIRVKVVKINWFSKLFWKKYIKGENGHRS